MPAMLKRIAFRMCLVGLVLLLVAHVASFESGYMAQVRAADWWLNAGFRGGHFQCVASGFAPILRGFKVERVPLDYFFPLGSCKNWHKVFYWRNGIPQTLYFAVPTWLIALPLSVWPACRLMGWMRSRFQMPNV